MLKNTMKKENFFGNIVSRVGNVISKHKGKIAVGTGVVLMFIFQSCKEKDSCEGVQDAHSTKKKATEVAANTMRITFREIQESQFWSMWNIDFKKGMQNRLENTGNSEPTTKDTVIVNDELCNHYINLYSSNSQFKQMGGQSIIDNKEANRVYIMTLEDLEKFVIENEACIKK